MRRRVASSECFCLSALTRRHMAALFPPELEFVVVGRSGGHGAMHCAFIGQFPDWGVACRVCLLVTVVFFSFGFCIVQGFAYSAFDLSQKLKKKMITYSEHKAFVRYVINTEYLDCH